MSTSKTMTFSLGDEKEREIRMILTEVYNALKEKGYQPKLISVLM